MTDMFSGFEKEIESLKEERNRFLTIAYNAIVFWSVR